MSVHVVPVTRDTSDPAELLDAFNIDGYVGQHNLGTDLIAVVAYRVEEASVWRPVSWWWSPRGNNAVSIQVPAETDHRPHEILLVT